MNKLFYIPALALSITCCTPKPVADDPALTDKEKQEALIQQNRDRLQRERARIDAYIDTCSHDFTRTGSGLYYSELDKSPDTNTIKRGDRVEFEYSIRTIEGTELASSEEKGNKNFRLLTDDEILGLHEGIAYMHPGDHYLFIIPSHLGYGIGGEDIAPMNATLLYKVKIVSINK